MHNFKYLFVILILTLRLSATCSLIQRALKLACGSTNTACTINATQGWNTTGTGHLIFAGAEMQDSAETITSVTGPGTFAHCDGTHTNCAASDTTAGFSADVYTTLNSTAAAGITVNRSLASGSWAIEVQEWSCSGSMAADNSGNVDNTSSSTTQPGVALTLTGSNDVIYQMATSAQTISAVSGGYTLVDSGSGRGFGYLANSTSGSAPNWTQSANARLVGSAVAITDNTPAATGGHNSMIPMMGVGE